MPEEALNIAKQLLEKDFNLTESLPEVNDRSALKKQMIPLLNHLLSKDMEKLLLVAYRLDLNELKFKSILTTAPPDAMADLLADMIIARELEKAETRIKYR